MVARSFFAIDNEALTIDPSSPSGTPGDPIINIGDTQTGTVFVYSDAFTSTQVTVDDTGGDSEVLEDSDADNHIVTDGGGLVADGQGVEAESLIEVRALDDDGDPTGPVITLTVFSQGGVAQDVWGFSTDTPLVDGARYVTVGGDNLGSSPYDTFVPCFTPDTRILTAWGPRPIETLRPGDLVFTRDNGPRPIAWIGAKRIGAARLKRAPALAPVRLAPGALGQAGPDRAILVSPNHRVLTDDYRTQLYFGEDEALVAAKHLVGRPGICRWAPPGVTYLHMMFDRHEVVLADGLWTESFQPAQFSMTGLGAAQAEEIYRIFPGLRQVGGLPQFAAARVCLRAREARLLAA